jgi:hypothetical protein
MTARSPEPSSPLREYVTESDRYALAWKDLHRRKRLFWWLFFGWIPAGSLAALVLRRLWLPVMLAYMAALVLVSLWLPLFICPRCRQRFFSWWQRDPFGATSADKCANCGLQVGAV